MPEVSMLQFMLIFFTGALAGYVTRSLGPTPDPAATGTREAARVLELSAHVLEMNARYAGLAESYDGAAEALGMQEARIAELELECAALQARAQVGGASGG